MDQLMLDVANSPLAASQGSDFTCTGHMTAMVGVVVVHCVSSRARASSCARRMELLALSP